MAAVSLLTLANVPGTANKKNTKNNFTYAAQQSLQQLYGTVENLQWSQVKDNMLRADFSVEGEQITSFFEPDGRFVATTCTKKLEQLPALVRKVVKNKFEGHEIISIVSYTNESDEAYFVEIRDGDKRKVFRINSNGGISRFN